MPGARRVSAFGTELPWYAFRLGVPKVTLGRLNVTAADERAFRCDSTRSRGTGVLRLLRRSERRE